MSSAFAFDTCLTSVHFDSNDGSYVSDGTSVYEKSGTNKYYTLLFSCPGVSSVTLNAETRVIKGHAFYGSDALVEVRMNDKLTTIQKGAFMQCSSIEYVRISPSVNEIENRAFDSCWNLKAIIYCSSDSSITYTGDPFPTNPTIYLHHTFSGDTCSFCGHECQPVLDTECNIPTHLFTCPPLDRTRRLKCCVFEYLLFIN
jgi:hypothetical protein